MKKSWSNRKKYPKSLSKARRRRICLRENLLQEWNVPYEAADHRQGKE